MSLRHLWHDVTFGQTRVQDFFGFLWSDVSVADPRVTRHGDVHNWFEVTGTNTSNLNDSDRLIKFSHGFADCLQNIKRASRDPTGCSTQVNYGDIAMNYLQIPLLKCFLTV